MTQSARERQEEEVRETIALLRVLADSKWTDAEGADGDRLRGEYKQLHDAAYLLGRLDVQLHHSTTDLSLAVEALKECGANFTICTNTSDAKEDHDRMLREFARRQQIAASSYESLTRKG